MEDSIKFAVFSGLTLIDDLTTAIACYSYGIDAEKTNWRKKLMERIGIWKSIPIQSVVSQIGYYTPILATYFTEKYANPSAQPLVHNFVLLAFALPIVYTTSMNILKLRGKRLETLIDN